MLFVLIAGKRLAWTHPCNLTSQNVVQDSCALFWISSDNIVDFYNQIVCYREQPIN